MLLAVLVACAAIVNAKVVTRIPADDTAIEKYPYQASIERKGTHICGGAIIGSHHIATAAQCFKARTESEYTVRIGTARPETSGTVHRVKQLRVHPGFRTTSLEWDIAVVILEEEISMGDTSKALSIVPENEEPKKGEILILSGWGHTSGDNPGERLELLQGVSVPALNREKCSEAYISWNITEKMLCAGGFLVADLGGPLVNEKNELVGVVSWMHKDNPAEKPALYANIASKLMRLFVKQALTQATSYEPLEPQSDDAIHTIK